MTHTAPSRIEAETDAARARLTAAATATANAAAKVIRHELNARGYGADVEAVDWIVDRCAELVVATTLGVLR